MSNVVAGIGLKTMDQNVYVNGQYVNITELSVGEINPTVHLTTYDAPGAGYVLMTDDFGGLNWAKPFESDSELRAKYPALEEAWGILMEALNEYQMVKKLVMEHKKDEL